MKIAKGAKCNLKTKWIILLQFGFIICFLLVLRAFEYKVPMHDPDKIQCDKLGQLNELIPVTYQEIPKAKDPESVKKVNPLKPILIDKKTEDVYEPSDSFCDFLDTPDFIGVNEEPEELDESLPFTIVDEMPIFNPDKNKDYQSGNTDLLLSIQKMLTYPTLAQESNIQGKVFVRFVVTKTGDIADAKIVRSVDPLLDNEVLRVI